MREVWGCCLVSLLHPPTLGVHGFTLAQVELGAEVNCADSTGTSALHYAVKAKSEELVRTLLEAGADPCAMDQYRRTSLALARSSEGAKKVLLPMLLSKSELDKARAVAKAAAESQEHAPPDSAAADENEDNAAPEEGGTAVSHPRHVDPCPDSTTQSRSPSLPIEPSTAPNGTPGSCAKESALQDAEAVGLS